MNSTSVYLLTMKCWASSIGSCSNTQSKEHLVSKASYRDDSDYISKIVRAYGMPWDEEKLIELPHTSISAKILCTHHNSALSELDSEAGRVAQTFLDIKDIASGKQKPQTPIITYNHSGNLLERWFLKTFLNFQSLYNKKELPPKELVEIVFGTRNFPNLTGLAIFGHNGKAQFSFDQDLKFVQILNNSRKIEYSIFEYFGINYLLPLTDQAMPKTLMNISHSTSGYTPIDNYIKLFQGSPTLLVHPKGIDYRFGDQYHVKIVFSW